jgi:hypothetical protein
VLLTIPLVALGLASVACVRRQSWTVVVAHAGLTATMIAMVAFDQRSAALLIAGGLALGSAALVVPCHRRCSPAMARHLSLCVVSMVALSLSMAFAPTSSMGAMGSMHSMTADEMATKSSSGHGLGIVGFGALAVLIVFLALGARDVPQVWRSSAARAVRLDHAGQLAGSAAMVVMATAMVLPH